MTPASLVKDGILFATDCPSFHSASTRRGIVDAVAEENRIGVVFSPDFVIGILVPEDDSNARMSGGCTGRLHRGLFLLLG